MKKNTILRISFVAGIAIFAFIVYRIGLMNIWENIKKISWQNFLILIGLRFFYWLLRTYNWKIILEGYNSKNSFLNLFAARMSSHAISHLTPAVALGGEAARAIVLNSGDMRINVASVIVDKTIEAFNAVLFTIIGLTIAIARISMPLSYKITLISLVVLFTVFLLFIFSKQKKGILGWLINLLARFKIKFKIVEKHKEKIVQTDAYISDFYNKHRKLFIKVFLLYSVLIFFWTVEIYYTLLFIGVRFSFLNSFVIVTLGTLAFAFPLTPASLGIYEAAYVGLFALLRMGTHAGFTLVLMRRIIAMFWAGIGLLGMLKRKSPQTRGKNKPPLPQKK